MDIGSGKFSARSGVWRFANAELDSIRRELRVGGAVRPVEAKPFSVLIELLCRSGEVVGKQELLEAVWPGVTVVEGSLSTAINKLRQALGDQNRAVIEVVPRIGYRIGVPVQFRPSDRTRQVFTFQPGDPVPRRPQWRLKRQLGLNPRADVWDAEHEKTGERRVFKFADSAERLDALKREAAMSRVILNALGERPDLPRVVEWDFDNQPFFLESLYGGEALPVWASSKGGLTSVPLALRIAMVAGVARSVAAAHSVGVLHGDIKPANIVIGCADDDIGMPRLVDFGVGRLTAVTRAAFQEMAGLGLTAGNPHGGVGTFPYLAPELLAGGALTTAADVYALGVLLFQMSTGDFDRPLAVGWEAMVEDPLLRQDIAETAAGDPTCRMASAGLLAQRLTTLDTRRAEALREADQVAQLAYLSERRRRERQLRPWLILLGLSLTLGIAGTVIAGLEALHRSSEARRQAELARAISHFLTDDLVAGGGSMRSGNAAELLVDAVQQAEQQVDTRFGTEPLVAGSVHLALANSLALRSAFDPARRAFGAAESDYSKAGNAGLPVAVIARLQQARMEALSREAGSLNRAKGLIAAARSQFGALGPRTDEGRLLLMAAEAMVQWMGGDLEKCHELLAQAADLATARPDIGDADLLLGLRRLEAATLMRQGKLSESETMLRQLLPQYLALHGQNHPGTLLLRMNLAQIKMLRGDTIGAVDAFDKLREGFLEAFGPSHEYVLELMEQHANAEEQLEHYDDAAREDLLVYQAAVAKQGADSFMAAGVLSDAADNECRAGHFDKGVADAKQAYSVARKAFGDDNGGTAALAGTAAFCLTASGNHKEAGALLADLNIRRASEFMADPTVDAQVKLAQADIAISSGNVAKGVSLLTEPRQTFLQPGADPYFRRWTEKLVRASQLEKH